MAKYSYSLFKPKNSVSSVIRIITSVSSSVILVIILYRRTGRRRLMLTVATSFHI